MSLHDLPRMVWQNGQSHGVILTIKPCSLLGHLQPRHQFIQHIDICLEPDSDSSDVILLIDEFSLIQDVIQLRAEYLIAGVPVNRDEVVIDEGGDVGAGIAQSNRVAAAVDDYPPAVVLAPSHIIYR